MKKHATMPGCPIVGLCLCLALAAPLGCGPAADGRAREIHQPRPAPAGGEYIVAHPLARMELPGTPRGLVLNGTALYAFLNQDGMAVLNVADPSSPALVGVIRGQAPQASHRQRYFYSGTLDGEELVVTDRSHNALMVYDVSEPLAPRLDRVIDFTEGTPVQVVLAGEHYIVSMGGRGIVRLPRTGTPRTAPQPLLVECDFVKDIVLWPPGFLLAADNFDGGLKIIDIADPARPRTVGGFLTGNFCEAIVPFDGFIAISNRMFGVMVLDMSRPVAPAVLTYWNQWPLEYAREIHKWGEHGLVVASSPASVDLFDLANPRRPVWMARIACPRRVTCLQAAGDLLFVGMEWPQPADPSRAGYQLAVYRLERRKSGIRR